MTDPYNSYGSHVPPATPAATARTARKEYDPIAHLNVSESWKRKFRLIDKAGGPDLPNFRNLSFGERLSVNFNILAFLFGPFYYLVKGLWRQAILYFIFAVILIALLETMGLGRFSRSVGSGFAAMYSFRANISYYKKAVLGDTPWL